MSPRFLVCALFFAHVTTAVRLGSFEKRDAPFVPQRLNIPLSFDSLGRYVASVSMGPNPGQQHFNFTMTTQTGLTYVAGKQCSGCSGVNLYDQSKSTSARSLSSANNVDLLGQSAAASIIKEDCQLKTINSTLWDYPNQTIVIVNQAGKGQLAQASDAQVGNGLSGLIGLATNRQSPSSSAGNSSTYTAQFGDSIAGQWLSQHPTALNFSFGMQLGKPLNIPRGNTSTTQKPVNTGDSDPGILHWLQPDPSAYDASKLTWLNATLATSQTPFANSTGDWYVSLDGWVLSSGSTTVKSSSAVVGTVDPMYMDLYLPFDQAREIHDTIEGSNLRPDLSSLGGLTQAWTIPCNSTFSFGIVVGSQTFTLDQTNLVLEQPDGTCVSAIEAWTDDTQAQFVFGARFLSTIYLIFNIPQDGSNAMGFAPRSSTGKKTNIGAIVGGTIGGVALVVFVGFAVFFFTYRRRNQAYRITAAQYDAAQEIEKSRDGTVEPFLLPSTTPTTVRFANAPQSTMGSDRMSSVPSPNATMQVFAHHENDTLDVAPPSYEVSEAVRRDSEINLPLPSANSEKDNLAAHYANASSSHIPNMITLSPEDAAGGSAMESGSATMYE